MYFRSFGGFEGGPGAQNTPLKLVKIILNLAKMTVFMLPASHDPKFTTIPSKIIYDIVLTGLISLWEGKGGPWKPKEAHKNSHSYLKMS